MVTVNINDDGGEDSSVAQEYTDDGELVELCVSAEKSEYYLKITDKEGNEKERLKVMVTSHLRHFLSCRMVKCWYQHGVKTKMHSIRLI